MKTDRELLVGLLAARERGALTSEDERSLRTLIAQDPEAADQAGWDEVLARLLTYSGTSDLGREEFTRGVASRIAAEHRGEPFVRRVTQASRRLHSRRPARPAGMPWGLAAAGAVLFFLAMAWGDGPAPARNAEPTPAPRIAASDLPRLQAPISPNPEPRADAPAPEPLQPPPVLAPRPTETSERTAEPAPVIITAKDPPKATVAGVGTVERIEDPVSRIREGSPLVEGQTIEARGRIVLRMNDGTRLELDDATSLRIGEGGKRLFLTQGTLQAEVTKQPRGTSMVFETPNGTATVLGTTLRLAVGRATTRLDVIEGKVRLSGENAKTVDVATGHFAVAAAGTELKARPIPDPRVTEGLRALYVFDEGKGRIIRDVSGAGTPLHLVAKDEKDLEWVPGGGLSLRAPTLVASSGPATKIVSACRSSRAITVEAWIKPALIEKGSLRYVAALGGLRKESVAFGLGLHADIDDGPTTYRAYLTTPKTGPLNDRMPDLETSPIVPGLAHLVFTRSASGVATLYVDGQEKGSGIIDGDFSTWSELRVMVGDYSFEGVRPWLGEFHLLAFYSRVLKPEEVARNFGAGKRKYSAKK